MAYNYLQLCNRVLRRLNEVQLTSANFTAAVGFQAYVQDCVNDALNDIYEAERHWPFLWATTTQNTTAYVQSYALPATYTEVDWNSFLRQPNLSNVNPVSGAKQPIEALKLKYLSYHDWQTRSQANDLTIIQSYTSGITTPLNSQGGPPTMVFPYQDRLNFGLTIPPDVNIYNISYDYWFKPTDLAAFGDVMVVPDRFVKVVVDCATWYAYMFRDNVEEAQFLQQKVMRGIADMRRQLVNQEDYMRSDQVVQPSINTPGYGFF